jgi:hypothetical protein
MDENYGLKAENESLKKQIHELHLTVERLSAEGVALKHALQVARGQISLLCRDRNYEVGEDAA